ncbi:hypothetical protein C8R44DRAFT_944948 [Mycena epipterygia]|nr:hypothetical protein C8R44DRAFT_944948 [Mycena epipterygia]
MRIQVVVKAPSIRLLATMHMHLSLLLAACLALSVCALPAPVSSRIEYRVLIMFSMPIVRWTRRAGAVSIPASDSVQSLQLRMVLGDGTPPPPDEHIGCCLLFSMLCDPMGDSIHPSLVFCRAPLSEKRNRFNVGGVEQIIDMTIELFSISALSYICSSDSIVRNRFIRSNTGPVSSLRSTLTRRYTVQHFPHEGSIRPGVSVMIDRSSGGKIRCNNPAHQYACGQITKFRKKTLRIWFGWVQRCCRPGTSSMTNFDA